MVRHFTDEPLDPAAVDRIVAAGLRAPSAGYSQGYALIVLESAGERERLWATHTPGTGSWAPDVSDGVMRAPLLVVVVASKDVYLDRYAEEDKGWTDRDEARWPVPYWYVDAGCVAMLLLLAAVDEGLGALLFGTVPGDVARLRDTFSIPASHEVVGCVAVGHEDPAAAARDLRARRRPVGELVHRGAW